MGSVGSVAELKDAVKDALQRKGLLSQLQANVRSQIFNVLLASEDVPRPEPTCDETLLVNELIREYLIYNGLRDTLSVFLPESGQPAVRPFDRDFLAHKLRINDTPQTQQVPLLYALVARQQQVPTQQLQHQQLAADGSGAAASSQGQQQQQQHRLAPGTIAAGRLPPSAGHSPQPLALKDTDSQFEELQSFSSASQTTLHL